MSSPYPSDPRSVELQALQGQLTTRVQAVEKDLARALSEHDRQIHRERLDELCADRQTVVDYLDAIEREQPLPGPWPIELRTSDPVEWLPLADPARALRTGGLWQRHFASRVDGAAQAAAAEALAGFQPLAQRFSEAARARPWTMSVRPWTAGWPSAPMTSRQRPPPSQRSPPSSTNSRQGLPVPVSSPRFPRVPPRPPHGRP